MVIIVKGIQSAGYDFMTKILHIFNRSINFQIALPEPMMTKICDVTWKHHATMSSFSVDLASRILMWMPWWLDVNIAIDSFRSSGYINQCSSNNAHVYIIYSAWSANTFSALFRYLNIASNRQVQHQYLKYLKFFTKFLVFFFFKNVFCDQLSLPGDEPTFNRSL